MKLQFCGAAKTVTGSCYYLDTGKHKILIDCGAFQGPDELEARNHDEFPFNPSEIDFVLLTHAHYDHCGRLPKLVKQGFRGRILCTSPTRDLASVVLHDSARIQKEDYERWQSRHKDDDKNVNSAEDGTQYEKFPPMYTENEVVETMDYIDIYPYGTSVDLQKGLEVRMRDSGHILGSASWEIWAKNEIGKTRKIVFSGDIGQPGKRIIQDPDMISEADYVIVESTYGNRLHKNKDETVLEFLSVLKKAQEEGGNILIPTFAIERAQEIIYELNLFVENKLLNRMDVYLDSPMAITATEIFRRYPNFYDEDARRLLDKGDDPFDFPGLRFTRDAEQSKRLISEKGSVIMAGSGMCTGGRIIHHLFNHIEKPETHILFVGYQVHGTLGRRIVDMEPTVRIKGRTKEVHAKIHTVNGFSGHADKKDLKYWLRSFGRAPRKVFIVHGAEEIAEEFANDVAETMKLDTYVPNHEEVVELD